MDSSRGSAGHDFYAPKGYAAADYSPPPRMALLVSDEAFVCARRGSAGDELDGTVLRIDKRTYVCSCERAHERPEVARQMTVAAVLGVLHQRSEGFLVVVTEAIFVGKVGGASIFGVRRAELLPFELQASVAARSRSDAVAREVESLEHTLSTGFYFSYDCDLSLPLCPSAGPPMAARQPAGGHGTGFSDEFCWNREMSEDFRGLPAPHSAEWATALICGSVQADTIDLRGDSSMPLPVHGQAANVALVARRSRLRCWPRSACGLDEEGNAAGLVWTEVVLEAECTVSSFQVVLGSCPLMWDMAVDGVCVGPEARSQDALARHVRQLRRLLVGPAAPHLEQVVLVAVDDGLASKRAADDAALRHAWQCVWRTASAWERREAGVQGAGKAGARRAGLCLPAVPAWSNADALLRSSGAVDVRGLVAALSEDEGGRGHAEQHLDGLQAAIHKSGDLLAPASECAQRVVCRLHGAHARDEAGQILSLSCAALALGRAAIRGLFVGAASKRAAVAAKAEGVLCVLWHRCAANLYRQASGADARAAAVDKDHGLLAATASKFSGLTGGVASSLLRKAAAGVSAASHALSSLAGSGAVDSGFQVLVHLRTPAALEARRMWQRHGLLCAAEASLWEHRPVRIFCGSWNAKGRVIPSAALSEWFGSCLETWGGSGGADVYVVGLQEGVALGAVNVLKDAGTAFADVLDADSPPASPRAGSGALATWQKEIERALREGENVGGLEVLAARQLVGVMLFVLAAPWVKRLISNVAAETCRTGLGGMAGNKGAVAVRMQIGASTCVFTNVHMAAHTKNVEQRNSDYQAIVGSLVFAGTAEGARYPDRIADALVNRRTAPPAHILAHDHVVFMGDLNYRIDGIEDQEVLRIVNRPREAAGCSELARLLCYDQLQRERRAGKVLWGLHEPPLAFPPTYKFSCDSDDYSGGGKGRLPAWTDRILFRNSSPKGLRCIKYTACMRVRGSDHKPVVALFELEAKVRPHADAKQVLVAALHKEQEQLGNRLKQLRQQSDACHDALRKHDRVAPSAPTSSNETSSLIDLNFEDCDSVDTPAVKSSPPVELASGPLDTKFPPQDVQAKGSPCEAVDLFEDAMPAVTWARQDGNQSVHRAGIIDDLFGLDLGSSLPPTPEQMSLAAKIAASPLPETGSERELGQNSRSHAKALSCLGLSLAGSKGMRVAV